MPFPLPVSNQTKFVSLKRGGWLWYSYWDGFPFLLPCSAFHNLLGMILFAGDNPFLLGISFFFCGIARKLAFPRPSSLVWISQIMLTALLALFTGLVFEVYNLGFGKDIPLDARQSFCQFPLLGISFWHWPRACSLTTIPFGCTSQISSGIIGKLMAYFEVNSHLFWPDRLYWGVFLWKEKMKRNRIKTKEKDDSLTKETINKTYQMQIPTLMAMTCVCGLSSAVNHLLRSSIGDSPSDSQSYSTCSARRVFTIKSLSFLGSSLSFHHLMVPVKVFTNKTLSFYISLQLGDLECCRYDSFCWRLESFLLWNRMLCSPVRLFICLTWHLLKTDQKVFLWTVMWVLDRARKKGYERLKNASILGY